MFVVSPSIVQRIINFSSILVSSDRVRVAAPSLIIIWFANDRRLVVSVLVVLIVLVLVIVVAGIPRRRRIEDDGDDAPVEQTGTASGIRQCCPGYLDAYGKWDHNWPGRPVYY